MHRRLIRWLPAVVAPVAVAGVALAAPMVANAAQPLPQKSAAQVLELVAKSHSIAGFSGTVQQTSALGLPSLPTSGAGSDSQVASTLNLLTGTHQARVWVSGRSEARVAVLDSMGERDVVRDGRTVWTWDSAKRTAAEVQLPSGTRSGDGSGLTPASAADALLSKLGPTTSVSVDNETTVAGRSTYTLVLTPKTDATTVGSVRVSVDGGTGLPLRVEVLPKGSSDPAFDIAFTSVSYAVPSSSTFDFTPPSGATVQHLAAPERAASLPSGVTTIGSGWSSVVEIPATDVPAGITSNAAYSLLTQPVSGGRVLKTAIVNVLRTDDGRVFAGAVPVSTLQSDAAQR